MQLLNQKEITRIDSLGGCDILGRVEKSIEIKVRPEKVWEMLALDRCPEWMDDLKSVKYTSEVRTPKDKYRVGASAHWIKVKQEEFDLEITESLENEKITTRTSPYHGVTLIATFALKPTEAGTEMAYAVDYGMPWSILGKILDKLFVRQIVRSESTRKGRRGRVREVEKHSGEIDGGRIQVSSKMKRTLASDGFWMKI